MTTSEVRKTSVTGGEKGQKIERHDLIVWPFIAALATVCGVGAEKYTEYGECLCAAFVINDLSTLVDGAGIATISGLRTETPSTRTDKSLTPVDGMRRTLSELLNISVGTVGNLDIHDGKQLAAIALVSSSTKKLLLGLADFARLLSLSDMWTTITRQGVSEVHFVTDAILVLASWKSEDHSGSRMHLSGCTALDKVEEGDDNWRKGYSWRLSYGALQRHLIAFWTGEDTDPETGLPHLAQAAWHCMVLWQFSTTPELYGQFDDRPDLPELAHIQAMLSGSLDQMGTETDRAD